MRRGHAAPRVHPTLPSRRHRRVGRGLISCTALLLAACSSGSNSPSDAGQIVVQSAPDTNSTTIAQLTTGLVGPSYNLGPTYSGIAVAPGGTPNAGSVYVPGRDGKVYRISSGSSPVAYPITGGQAVSSIQIAPHGARNAGAVLVLTDQGLTVLQPSGSSTNVPIPSPAGMVVGPQGAANAGTAYITSKASGSLYVVDPLATTARSIDVGVTGGDPAVAPTKTPDAGTVFVYPDPDNLGDDGQPATQFSVISPAGAVLTAPLPQGTQLAGPVVAAVGPAKTDHAGCLYFAGSTDGHLYVLSPDARLQPIQAMSSTNTNHGNGLHEILIAGDGAANAGAVYLSTDQGVIRVDPNGHASTVISGTIQDAPTLLAIAPPKTPTAGTVYVSQPTSGDGTVIAIKPDGSQATFQLPNHTKLAAGIVIPAGSKLAGTLLAWDFYDQGLGSLSPDGKTSQIGYYTGISDVMVVPK